MSSILSDSVGHNFIHVLSFTRPRLSGLFCAHRFCLTYFRATQWLRILRRAFCELDHGLGFSGLYYIYYDASSYADVERSCYMDDVPRGGGERTGVAAICRRMRLY